MDHVDQGTAGYIHHHTDYRLPDPDIRPVQAFLRRQTKIKIDYCRPFSSGNAPSLYTREDELRVIIFSPVAKH